MKEPERSETTDKRAIYVTGRNQKKEGISVLGAEDIKVFNKGYKKTDIAQTYANLAFKYGGEDLVRVIQCEADRTVDAIGDHGDSVGMCQINLPSHPNLSGTLLMADADYQIRTCAELRKGGTRFNGPDRIESNGKTCYENAKNTFIFYDK